MAETRQDRYHGHGHGHHEEENIAPDVEKFLVRMRETLISKQVDELAELYEIQLPILSEKYYTTIAQNPKNPRQKNNTIHRPWPQPAAIKQLVGKNDFVNQVYLLLQIRSQSFKSDAKSQNRSWDAHGEALRTFVESSYDLPNGWIWDIVDEFVYQLSQSRTRRPLKDAPQSTALPAQGWSVNEAINRLEDAVARSGIRTLLENIAKDKADAADVVTSGEGHLKRVLGYSALVGIVKIRVLLGDYHGALEAAEPLLLRGAGSNISTKIAPLHAALYYHVGVAYFMLRRYSDAISMLEQVMNVRSSRKFFDALQGPAVRLIVTAGILGDTPAPDYSALVGERYKLQDDDLILLAQGDLDRYRDIFTKCAPKYISSADPSASETGNEPKEAQLAIFLRGVSQQLDVLKMRGYLTTYSTLTADKVGSLLNRDASRSVESHLVCMKSHTRQRVRAPGKKSAEGDVKRVSTVDFTADKGTIAVHKNAELPTIAAAFFDRLMALKSAKPAAA